MVGSVEHSVHCSVAGMRDDFVNVLMELCTVSLFNEVEYFICLLSTYNLLPLLSFRVNIGLKLTDVL